MKTTRRPLSASHFTGDLLCPGVDVDRFKATCRVPLFPNEWNTWEVLVSSENIRTESEAVDAARNFLRHVFSEHESTLIGQETLGPVEYVTASLGGYSGAARKTAARRESVTCDFLPSVKTGPDGSPGFLITIAFVFRGVEKTWPWPTLGFLSQGVFNWCPVDAELTLSRAFYPIPGAQTPARGGTWQAIKDEYPDFAHGAEVVGSAVASFVGTAFSRTAFFLAGGALGAFLLWKTNR